MLKINLGIAIVCMVNSTALHQMKTVNHVEDSHNVDSSHHFNETNQETEVMCLFKESAGHKMVRTKPLCSGLNKIKLL